MHLGPKDKDRRCGFVINGPDTNPKDFPTRICDLRVPEGINGFSEGEANASLIASAPALTTALDQCVEALALVLPLAEKYLSKAPGDPENAKLETARAALEQAKKATS